MNRCLECSSSSFRSLRSRRRKDREERIEPCDDTPEETLYSAVSKIVLLRSLRLRTFGSANGKKERISLHINLDLFFA